MKLTGNRNQCPGCKQFFNSNGAFDMHRAGEHKGGHRYCLTPDAMHAQGMHLGQDGFWRGEAMPEHLKKRSHHA